MTSILLHQLTTDMEAVAQQVLAVQKTVAEMCGTYPAQYQVSALARSILIAAQLGPVPVDRAQHLAQPTQLVEDHQPDLPDRDFVHSWAVVGGRLW